jgi:thioredoxin 1
MRSWFRSNWWVLAAMASMMLVTALSLGRPPGACNVPKTASHESLTPAETDGEKTMSGFAQTHGQVHHADEANFDQLVLDSDVPVLVDFYADWCFPCQRLTPTLEELARETTDAKIVKVNVEHHPDLAARYGVRSIPSLKVFKDGQITGERLGLADKAQLRAMLDL